jgi:hypothetical protein
MNRNTSLKLEPLDGAVTHVEAISVFGNGDWSSPKGGWLDGVRGAWKQKPEGVILYASTAYSEPPVGRLLGLTQAVSAVGENANFDFTEPIVIVGRWTLISEI